MVSLVMIFKLDLSIRLGTSNRSSFDSLGLVLDLDTSLNIADSLHTKEVFIAHPNLLFY